MSGSALNSLITWVPALALAFGVYQYRLNSQNEERKRAREKAIEAANEVAAFRREPNSDLALKLLDYQDMRIRSAGEETGSVSWTITPDKLARALRYHVDNEQHSGDNSSESREGPRGFSEMELRVRDIFDDFFTRLERIDGLISADVIDQGQLGDLFSYWLKLMGERPLSEDMTLTRFEDPQREVLWRYIRMYEFNGVVRLFARYGRADKQGIDPKVAFRAKRIYSAVDAFTNPLMRRRRSPCEPNREVNRRSRSDCVSRYMWVFHVSNVSARDRVRANGSSAEVTLTASDCCW